MDRLSAKGDYETLRNARILENQERLKSLGLQKTISELRSIISSSKPVKKKYPKVDYSSTPMRRSNRLNGTSPEFTSDPIPIPKPRLLSRDRGVKDPLFGIVCHSCSQRTLCGEEDCKRCRDLDFDQPCIGKTDCSMCHFSRGVLCRACLKGRYGEEMEEVRENKQWMCPHCIEEKGINPYWICNQSLCLRKRKMVSPGLTINRVREMGYKSVAHLIMDELQQKRQ